MEIKTFGKITEIINTEIALQFPATIAEIKTQLEATFPALSSFAYCIAVDGSIISDEKTFVENPKILAILPPFSGG